MLKNALDRSAVKRICAYAVISHITIKKVKYKFLNNTLKRVHYNERRRKKICVQRNKFPRGSINDFT